jgi:hypothetical protein
MSLTPEQRVRGEYVYNLELEDASHLGGPMGTEYTTTIWVKPFASMQRAKAYAEKYAKKKGNEREPEWKKSQNTDGTNKHVFWDAGAYIFNIHRVKIG